MRDKIWTVWKHALGSYSEQDGYNPNNDDVVGIIRTFIVFVSIITCFFIIANIGHNW